MEEENISSKVKKVKGKVLSRFDGEHLLAENGAYLFENMRWTYGWIYAELEPNSRGIHLILEKNICGHKRLWIEKI